MTHELLVTTLIEYDGFQVIGDAGSYISQQNNTLRIHDTLRAEWERSRRIKRTFTEFGFSKARVPDDLWGSISSYYYNNRNSKVREEWEKKVGC